MSIIVPGPLFLKEGNINSLVMGNLSDKQGLLMSLNKLLLAISLLATRQVLGAWTHDPEILNLIILIVVSPPTPIFTMQSF